MVREMHDYRITQVNPFDPDTYQSKNFYKSRKEYKTVTHPVFLAIVENVARIVRSLT